MKSFYPTYGKSETFCIGFKYQSKKRNTLIFCKDTDFLISFGKYFFGIRYEFLGKFA